MNIISLVIFFKLLLFSHFSSFIIIFALLFAAGIDKSCLHYFLQECNNAVVFSNLSYLNFKKESTFFQSFSGFVYNLLHNG